MKIRIYLLIIGLIALSAQATYAKDKESTKKWNKTGIYFMSSTYNDGQQWQRGETYGIGLFHNYRFIKTLYYQPELSYHLTQGEGHSLQTHLHFVPLQLQFGLHLGLIRPFISGGVYYHFSASSRDAEGKAIHLGSLSERSAYGYFYGGGIDFINTLQLFYRQQNNGLSEHQIGLSLIF